MSKNWFEKSYRRNLLDMHIEDWDERFLSKFDPKKYVELLKLAHVKSTMFYANSHVGLCYWPTKTGQMHRGLKGRDILGELITLCHKEGIDVVIYYSVVYNNWAYSQHPDWRLTYLNGTGSRDRPGPAGRYGFCCPNSPGYRKFVVDQIEELCKNYDFEGVFFDMTFWPGVCYCINCKERYKQEIGAELPTKIDWYDPAWLNFQKMREKWITEFTALCTNAVKKYKPEAALEHQCSSVVRTWIRGVDNTSFAEQFDFTAGDFYGGILQQSFICKMFYNLTKRMPFEFHTSICYPSLGDHTTVKSKNQIRSQVFMTLAHHGAFNIIDAIDPEGTVEKKRYKIIGEIYNEVRQYEDFLYGELCQDVAVYFSSDSKMNFEENGKITSQEVIDSIRNLPLAHVKAALGAANILRTGHIPFGV
ncbi:MAG: alpha-L-fucosidase, partial [Candidatus Jordarchaeaceae archaeon]